MKLEVLATFDAETPEAKARWFRSLTVQERIRVFCEWCDLALAMNPHIAEKKNRNAPRAKGPVCILPRP
jgi:hypothetical protein